MSEQPWGVAGLFTVVGPVDEVVRQDGGVALCAGAQAPISGEWRAARAAGGGRRKSGETDA